MGNSLKKKTTAIEVIVQNIFQSQKKICETSFTIEII